MGSPCIGIPKMGSSPARRYMQHKYIACLRQAGAQVCVLKPTTSPQQILRDVARCDGFIFPGGPDIAPVLYGQKVASGCGTPNPVRDAYELPLLRSVLAAGKPVVCICRGMQLLNVAQGGTLLQDIRSMQTFQHADFFHRKTHTHPVTLAPNSLVEQIFGCAEMQVNSLHHQAVDHLGTGLRATAHSPDGFVEALEMPGYPTLLLGVQWHPEHMSARTPVQQKIFSQLIAACG